MDRLAVQRGAFALLCREHFISRRIIDHTGKQFAAIFREGTEIRKLTVGFIRSMIMPRGGVRNLGKRPNWSNQVWEIYERTTGKKRPDFFAMPQAGNSRLPSHDDLPI